MKVIEEGVGDDIERRICEKEAPAFIVVPSPAVVVLDKHRIA